MQTPRPRMQRRNNNNNTRTNNNNRYNNNRRPTRHYSNNMSLDNNEDLQVTPGSKLYHQAIQSRHKYNEMAKDAMRSGDRILAESWYQHVDHFNRIITEADETYQEKRILSEKPEDHNDKEDNYNVYDTENENKYDENKENDENSDYIKPLEHCLPPMVNIDTEDTKEGH